MSSSAAPNANRWFVLAVLCLCINAFGVGWLVLHRSAGGRTRLVKFTPGENQVVSNGDSLTWQFSAAMVPPTEVDVWRAAGPVQFEPATEGRYCWTMPDTLVFQPLNPWRPCTHYSAFLAPGLSDLPGRPVRAPRRFAFATAALQLLSVQQVNATDDRRATLRLEFNAPLGVFRVDEHLRVALDNGAKVHYEGVANNESSILLVQTAPIRTDGFSVTVLAGLPAAAGPLGLPQTVVSNLTFSGQLALRRIEPESASFEAGSIAAYFSAPLDVDSAPAAVEVSPAVPFTVAQANRRWDSSGIRLNGDFEPGRNYAVTFKAGLKSQNGQRLGTNVTRQVYFPDRPASVAFRTSGRYLSPRGSLIVPVTTVNVTSLAVTAERVYPNNLVFFAARETGRGYGRHYYGGSPADDLSRITGRQKLTMAAKPNAVAETPLRLTDFMGEYRSGAYLLTASSDKAGAVRHLVVVTDIGLSVKRSPRGLLVWANSILTLKPVTGAVVRAYTPANQEIARAETDAQGLAHLQTAMSEPEQTPFLVTVESGDDLSYLALDGSEVPLDEGVGQRPFLDTGYEAYVYTDRGVYRPGETCHARCVVRDRDLKCPEPFPLALHIVRPDDRQLPSRTAMLTALGTGEYEFTWPDYVPTGPYRLEVGVPGADQRIGETTVSLEEFVPPQIKVDVNSETNRARDRLDFTVTARFLFGRPAEGLPVSARVAFTPEPFQHPAWPDYVFNDHEKSFARVTEQLGSSRLDAAGAASFQARARGEWRPPSALKATLAATVSEPSGRAVSAFTSRRVDIYPYYVGIRPPAQGGVLPLGATQTLALAVVQPDGTPAANPSLRVKAGLLTWSTILKKVGGAYRYTSERRFTPDAEQVVALRNGRGEFRFCARRAGQHLVVAEAPEVGASASVQFGVASPDAQWVAWSMEKPDRVELSLDQEEYRPGDTATLLIKSPFAGKALLTLETDRVVSSQVLDLDQNTRTVAVPVASNFGPNVYCVVSVIRPVVAGELGAGHRAAGVIPLKIVRPERRLTVAIAAPAAVRPQSPLRLNLRVTDADGRGVPAEVSLAAVDEGICLLTDFLTPDPLDFFGAQRTLGVELFDLYGLLMPEIKESVLGAASSPGGDGAAAHEIRLAGRLNPIKARRFKPVALWKSAIATDAGGQATVELAVPEFTGTLRAMAVAVDRERFGSAEQPVIVKRPLVVLSGLPRFLTPGDACTMPVTVFNESGANRAVDWSVRCGGPLAAEPAEGRLLLAAGSNAMFQVQMRAQAVPGTATARLAVGEGLDAYDETFELPVRPASARTTVGDAGSVAGGAAVTVRFPTNWLAGTGRHALWCSGLPAIKLAGALDYLLRYPYGCIEQTTSASFPLLYLADLAGALRPGSMGPEQTAHYVQAGVDRVLSMQQPNGGFAYWPNTHGAYEWGSVYATHFLVEAVKAGYAAPPASLAAALRFLDQRLDATVRENADENRAGWQANMNLRSYAGLVLALAGQPPRGWLNRLQEQVQSLDRDATLNLAAALAAAGRRREAAAILGAAGAPAIDPRARETGGSLGSDVRSAALLLSAWLDVDPDHPAVPAVVRRLEAVRLNGGWHTTQDNALALMALGKYCRRLQRDQQPFTGAVRFRGAQGETAVAVTQAKEAHWEFDAAGTNAVVIANQGPGTLYYYWQSAGIAADGDTPAVSDGLSVWRELLDARGGPLAGDAVKQGDLVVVKVTVDPRGRPLENIVVEDLLPAGLEIENARLATSQVLPWIGTNQTCSLRHSDIRDDRMVAFVGEIGCRQTYFYAARAVTPGRYVYPAIAAECMYDPSVRCVGEKRVMTVEP